VSFWPCSPRDGECAEQVFPCDVDVYADGDAPVMPEIGKTEDCEAIKQLPKFDNFGSLSDLGSLFSRGGPGRSMDVRSGSRHPPRANVSVTSPHPALAIANNAKANGADATEETLQAVLS
jgi:hypothetical protein